MKIKTGRPQSRAEQAGAEEEGHAGSYQVIKDLLLLVSELKRRGFSCLFFRTFCVKSPLLSPEH